MKEILMNNPVTLIQAIWISFGYWSFVALKAVDDDYNRRFKSE